MFVFWHSFFISSERASVWSSFYEEVGELYMNVLEKPISSTVQLPLFLVGLAVLGFHLNRKLKKFTPLI